MKRFNSFQGLRVIAFLLVFFSHCNGFLPIPSGGHGAIGVEIFFVMSGFLMEVNAKDRDGSLIRQCVDCAGKKLRKFYWLHILTMLLALVPTILGWILQLPDLRTVLEVCSKIAANLFLIQSWVPDSAYYFSLNGVTWYLSTSMFMYLLFPLLHRWISKLKMGSWKYGAILLIYAFQLVLAVRMNGNPYLHAVIYIHPTVRCIDFIAGMLLGSAFRGDLWSAHGNTCWTGLEAMAVGMLVMVVLLFAKLPETFSYVVLCAPAAWLLMAVFAHEQGTISKLLSWKPVLFLGNISFELFMVHRIVIGYWEYVQWIARRVIHQNLPGIVSTGCTFIISVAAAWMLHEIGKKLNSGTKRI